MVNSNRSDARVLGKYFLYLCFYLSIGFMVYQIVVPDSTLRLVFDFISSLITTSTSSGTAIVITLLVCGLILGVFVPVFYFRTLIMDYFPSDRQLELSRVTQQVDDKYRLKRLEDKISKLRSRMRSNK